MCGIAGFLGAGDLALLERMAALMVHRGPDDGGFWISGDSGQGFAHRRLSILDLSDRGHQPMQDEQGLAVVCYNGEIYNFAELRTQLAHRGWQFSSSSDTEVLLKGYLEYGHAIVDKLNGIFAFAIHDSRNHETFLARDPLGVKPLYLAELAGTVLFASELKSLLADPRVSRDLDPVALQRYLTFLWCPGDRTPLRAVRRMDPGSAALVRNGKVIRTWKYCRISFGGASQMSVEECVEGVLNRLRQAVQRQMVSDVPVGAFLSGGLDSSAIVALAREFTGSRPLECFTMAPDSKEMAAEGVTDDMPYARRVADHLGVRLHAIPVKADAVRLLGQAIFHLDEPIADPAAINVMLISGLAREHGIKVLLSGAGGDDILSGYRRHRAYAAEFFWSWLPAGFRGMIGRSAGALHVSNPALRKLRKVLQNVGGSSDERLVGYFHWSAPESAARLLAAAPDHAGADLPLLETLHDSDPAPQGLDRMLLLEQRHFLGDHNLIYTDKLTMAAGVEARVPFLDPDLMEFANSLPPSIKQRHGAGKWLLKRAMEPFLPKEVIYRPKTGFGAPLRKWVRKDLVPVIDDLLSVPAMDRRGVFHARNVRTLIEQDRAGIVDASYTVFSVLCIELWARTFLDSPQPARLNGLPGLQ